jgi:archaemetzincin
VGTNAADNSILISPVGTIDASLFASAGRKVEALIGLPVKVTPLLQDLDFAFDAERSQYYSTRILEKLAHLAPASALKVIGITTVDLFIPILTHVYGEAQLGGRSCIISLYRLNEPSPTAGLPPSLKDRAVKEILHELGHTFALRHCPVSTCVMHYCRSLRDVDRKDHSLCRHCSVMLNDELHRMGIA